MKNLPDTLRVVLTRNAHGSYDATVDNAVAPEVRKGLACKFHKAEPAVFACLGAKNAWGVYSSRRREQSVDTDGNETTFDGYVFELVKNPLGDEPRTTREVRVGAASCRQQ